MARSGSESGGDATGSPFLAIDPSHWTASNELAFAIRDKYPVSEGHTLVIPKRLVTTWFEASDEEQRAIFALVDEVKAVLDEELRPDGYNVGFNAGEAAGQTVMHLHVHVIPRFRGDMDDPRGGVRHVIPSEGNYLRTSKPLATGGDDPFAHHVFPLFARATDVAIVAAFVQESGLRKLWCVLGGALRRGVRVRLLTGDYLGITQAEALQQLLDWERAIELPEVDDEEGPAGELQTRVIEVAKLPGGTRSFHPKSWRFEGPRLGVAFVGSSNLSYAALGPGIEWNLRVDRDRDRQAYDAVASTFAALWEQARELDQGWIDEYARRVRERPQPLPPGELTEDAPRTLPEPHEAQVAALERLRAAREEGRSRSLVVLATGLGKTLVSVLDYAQLWDERGTPRPPRLLFLAHRRELLLQAASAFRTLLRSRGVPSDAIPATVGWFAESARELHADLVFASVAKLARAPHLEALRQERFDYVVVDEVHHAAAASYRKILDALAGDAFFLGLTATPERADGLDIHGLFDDHVAHRAGIDEGIRLERLVPFHYFGVKDDIDYDHIPWRNRRFAIDELVSAAQTEARMETLWRAWGEHPGTRTLVFCCSIGHANFVRDWLRERDVTARAIHSGPEADDRTTSLHALAQGDIDVVCAVDVLNEGVDVPSIDRVVMLRPTESSTVFLQQLGRGLRADPGGDKAHLTVIDFVGNHRIFVQRMRALLSLGGDDAPTVRAVVDTPEAIELPEGCSVDLELEAKAILQRFLRRDGADVVEQAYRELAAGRGEPVEGGGLRERPTAGEMQRLGYPPRGLRDRHGGWFEFVQSEGHLLPEERAALDATRSLLAELESGAMTKSYKMVTLQALLEHDALLEGMPVEELSRRAHAILRRDPRLLRDVPDKLRPPLDDDASRRAWRAYWKKNPIAAWTKPTKSKRAWFRIDGDRFVPDFPLDGGEALARMVAELVDYRLAQYRAREAATAGTSFECKVTWNKRDPILKLPALHKHDRPEGDIDARLEDGSVWTFGLRKEFCNVARPAGPGPNRLPQLLREWFGPSAGQPGTHFRVRFEAGPDGWTVVPLREARVVPLFGDAPPIAYYPDIRAAAGHAAEGSLAPEATPVILPLKTDDVAPLFAVRVSGDSMDGGAAPMRHGDWAVFRVARDLPASSVEGRVTLVQLPSATDAHAFQIKRLHRDDDGWTLRSDNPDGPTIRADASMVVVGRLERNFAPDALAPTRGTLHPADALPTAFGIDDLSPTTPRAGGHLFLFVREPKSLVDPTTLRHQLPADALPLHPAETAYALAATDDGRWRYLGVAHPTSDGPTWLLPEVDVDTWRTYGTGGVSRPLPPWARERAREVVDALMRLPERERWLEQASGSRAQILARAKRGGLRITGEPDEPKPFKPRTVSLDDIGWVVAADEDKAKRGGLLDEARVNRLRYLEGTSKSSTRYIDTAWALAALERARPFLPQVTETLQVIADDGQPLDARFHLEQRGDELDLIIHSRGGTAGGNDARNTDYARGLEILLKRLRAAGVLLVDAWVDSSVARRRLDENARRLQLDDAYPVTIGDPAELRRALGKAMAQVGREPGAKGAGNATKQVRLRLGGVVGVEELRRMLVGQR